MATVQQIIYNLENYGGAGLISTAAANRNSTISWDGSDEDKTVYENGRINIYQNLIGEEQVLTKLGIQGPPGTVFHAGSSAEESQSKRIMIGRSGVYELDQTIEIRFLKFEQPIKYKLDEGETGDYLREGMAELQTAETARDEAIRAITSADNVITDWTRYIEIQTAYDAAYNAALGKYNLGINGVYKEDGKADLKNIIIDFIY